MFVEGIYAECSNPSKNVGMCLGPFLDAENYFSGTCGNEFDVLMHSG